MKNYAYIPMRYVDASSSPIRRGVDERPIDGEMEGSGFFVEFV